MLPNREPAMRAEKAHHVPIRATFSPHPASTAPRWTGRRVLCALLGIWAAAAALLAAVIIGIVWDLRP